MKGTILFTDIKGSSVLWRKFPEEMYKALKIHDKIIERASNKNNGMIIKNIGDSIMIYFPTAIDAIKSAIKIQECEPIQVGTLIMRIRIGMASGTLKQKKYKLQGCELIDFFGHTVNVAARMESNVSDIGGIAIAFLDTKDGKMSDEIMLFLKKSKYKFVEVLYKDNCPRTREKALNILGAECRLADELKGVGELRAYKIQKK